jgi:DnaA family protein
LRATARGMEMNDEVANFIINRSSRSAKELFSLLDVLDRKSLADKRKLTIPFVREVIG